jgi:dienelactone hydrolase
VSAATVRAIFTAATAPGAPAPFATIHAKVHYPARATGSDDERLTGMIPPHPDGQPYPVVLVLGGVNVGPEAYGWLAQRLAADGAAVVTYSWVGELFPGQYGLTPGIDISAVTPDTYGSRPTATAVRPLLDALADPARMGPLAGILDLDRVALVGHSAGGTMVLQNCGTEHFPEVRGGVTYGGHNAAATTLGWEPGTVLPCPGAAPLLLLGGTDDGVIARSADRYGGHRIDPLRRTFDEAIAADRPAYLAVVDGANHFALGHPEDPTVARGFLDGPGGSDPAATRGYLGDLIAAFLAVHLHGRRDATSRLHEMLRSDRLATSRTTIPDAPAVAAASAPEGGPTCAPTSN